MLDPRPSLRTKEAKVREFTAIIERDRDTGLYVGYVPGFPGAHSQGTTLDELSSNMAEVLALLLEDATSPRCRCARMSRTSAWPCTSS